MLGYHLHLHGVHRTCLGSSDDSGAARHQHEIHEAAEIAADIASAELQSVSFGRRLKLGDSMLEAGKSEKRQSNTTTCNGHLSSIPEDG